jgi:hypothetical protein
MKERRKRLIRALIDQSEYDCEKALALHVLAQSMVDLVLRGKDGMHRKLRHDARQFFFDPLYRSWLDIWCDRAEVNRNMVVRRAWGVVHSHHV